MEAIKIKELKSVNEYQQALSDMLIAVVGDGASIGFLPPMKLSDANGYWESVLDPDVILLVAKIDGRIAGSVQLHLCSKENGRHRAEIAKLMTHPDYRRRGIGKLLMQKAEERAKQENRVLLVLDTREGDPSNLLYQSLDFVHAGRIPHYARSENGDLHATVLYYKELG